MYDLRIAMMNLKSFWLPLFIASLLLALFGCSPQETAEQKQLAVLMKKASIEADRMKPTRIKDRSLLDKLRSSKDEMEDTVHYYPESPHSVPTSELGLNIFQTKSGDLLLSLNLLYYGYQGLYINRAWTKFDGNPVDVPVGKEWSRRAGGSGSYYEFTSTVLDSSGILFIKKLIATPKPTIRFQGSDGYDDYKPSERQIDAIRTVLAAYEAAMGINIE